MNNSVAVNFAGTVATDIASLLTEGCIEEAKLSVSVLIGITTALNPDMAYNQYGSLSGLGRMTSAAELSSLTGTLLRYLP